MAPLWLLPLAAAVVGLVVAALLARALRRELVRLEGTRALLEGDRRRLADLQARAAARGRSGSGGVAR